MTLRSHKALAAAFVAPLMVFSLAACGSDDKDSDKDASEENTSEASESPSEEASDEASESESASDSASASSGGAVDADLTAAGTELKLGESAVVPGDYGGNEYALEVTVNSIDPGTDADLKSLKLDATQFDAFYVKVTAEVVSGDADGGDPTDGLVALSGDTPARQIIEFGSFTPCNGEDFDGPSPAGTTLETCAPFAVAKGQKADSVAFTDTEGDPIIWK